MHLGRFFKWLMWFCTVIYRYGSDFMYTVPTHLNTKGPVNHFLFDMLSIDRKINRLQ